MSILLQTTGDSRMVGSKCSSEASSEDASPKSVDMEIYTSLNSPSRPSSPENDSLGSTRSSSPSDLSIPISSVSPGDDLPAHGSPPKVIPRNFVSTIRSVGVLPIPRTAPCIVLSPNPSNYTSAPTSHSPDSIMSQMTRLSNSVQGSFRINRLSTEGECLYSGTRDRISSSIKLHDSLKEIIRENRMAGETENLSLMCGPNNEGKVSSTNNTISKQLAFGIDRILSSDNRLPTDKKDDDEPKPAFSDPIGALSGRTHTTHHPNYLSQCTECFLLSRFCYKVQVPGQQRPVSGSGCPSSYSAWAPSQHLYDSPVLLSPSGYSHQHPALSPYGIGTSNYSTMSSMVSCNTGGSGRRKRSWSRAVFSNLQRKGLEKRFQIQKYITKPDRRQLAATLGLTDPQVKVWFQNRRMKWRHTTEGKARTEEAPTTLSKNNSSIGVITIKK